MLRRLLGGGARGAAEPAASSASQGDQHPRHASLCARFCQLPQQLLGDGASAHAFESSGGGLPRVRGGRAGLLAARGADRSADALSPLRQRERDAADKFQKYLLEPDAAGEAAAFLSASEDIGAACDICSVHEATHFALPCRHRACRVCWARWLAESPNCMTCAKPVAHVSRFPESALPLTLYERAAASSSSTASPPADGQDALRRQALATEQALERAVRGVLQVKDRLGAVVEGLHAVEAHLFNITRPEPGQLVTIETLTSVLAVERSSVLEQLRAHEAIFARGGDWDAMDLEFAHLTACVDAARALLAAQRRDAQGPAADVAAARAEALEVFESLVAANALAGQWARLKAVLARCGPGSNLVQGISRVFGMIHLAHLPGAQRTDVPELAQRAVATAQARLARSDTALNNELLPRATQVRDELLRDDVALA